MCAGYFQERLHPNQGVEFSTSLRPACSAMVMVMLVVVVFALSSLSPTYSDARMKAQVVQRGPC